MILVIQSARVLSDIYIKIKTMKFFNAKFETVIWRFYLLMIVVILPFFLGIPVLSILALPIFLSALMGVSFRNEKRNTTRNLVQSKENDLKVAA